jgi:hypothetical protein
MVGFSLFNLKELTMKKMCYIFMICQVICFDLALSRAEDYSECRARCDRQNADCMSEPQAKEPEVQLAKEAACSKKFQLCYAECENLKPLDDYTVPERNPNIIRK